MGLNIGKVLQVIFDHTDIAIQAVEAVKGLFSKSADKQAAATAFVTTAVQISTELTGNEQEAALVPGGVAAIQALIDAKVAVMNAEAKIKALVAQIKVVS